MGTFVGFSHFSLLMNHWLEISTSERPSLLGYPSRVSRLSNTPLIAQLANLASHPKPFSTFSKHNFQKYFTCGVETITSELYSNHRCPILHHPAHISPYQYKRPPQVRINSLEGKNRRC